MVEKQELRTELGDMFSGAVEYQAKQLGLRYLSEEEYANQIRSLGDSISPRREPFSAPFLSAKHDDFGAWIFATTSSVSDVGESTLQTIRVNPQSRILTAIEMPANQQSIQEAIAEQELEADRKFVHFNAPDENGAARLSKYHRVEALIGRLQTELIRRTGEELDYNLDLGGKLRHENLNEVLGAVKTACKKHPQAMSGLSIPLGFSSDKAEVFTALSDAGVLNPFRAKVAKHMPSMEMGFADGLKLSSDINRVLKLSFFPQKH